ncbi:MAG: dienelactone hydrolase family protein [Thermoanaerobaculia bacterium]
MRSDTQDGPVLIDSGDVVLDGHLTSPSHPVGCIIVASLGSTARQSGYRRVADQFSAAGYAVLTLDALTAEEQQIDARTEHYRWNISLLAKRLRDTMRWLERSGENLPVLIFASGHLAAAALRLDSMTGDLAGLLLTGARMDIVSDDLPRVQAPTLLIVAESDPTVMHMNNVAVAAKMKCMRRIEVIRDVTKSLSDEQMIDSILLHSWRWTVDHTLLSVEA